MRKASLGIILITFICDVGVAAEPSGEWRVADGNAVIRIEPCANALWGVISWVREPGYDSQNPDPAKRGRSVIGVPILRGMKPVSANKWKGEVYNAKNGRMYSATITLVSEDVLKIEGCVLGGLFCGGENWTREPVKVKPPATLPRAKQPVRANPKDPTAASPEACYE